MCMHALRVTVSNNNDWAVKLECSVGHILISIFAKSCGKILNLYVYSQHFIDNYWY